MKKFFAFALALLMVVSLFAACGETPDETTAKAPETTTTPSQSVPPVTTAPDTSAPPVTTAPDTTDTTAPETTTTPETDPEPLEPTIAADSAHTEHIWYTLPTYTAYEAKQADGTIGYYATHCRYEGCDAIKDGKIRPILVNMDFEGFTGTLAKYADEAENVCAHKKGANNSPGNVADGMGVMITSKGQCIISTDFVWEYDKEYYIAMDFQLKDPLSQNKNSCVLTFGKGSMTEAAKYFVGIGYNLTDGKWYVEHNFGMDYELVGIQIEGNRWYRLEYVVTMGSADAAMAESPSFAERNNYLLQGGATTMYLTPMHRNLDGEMVIAGERIYLGTFAGIAAMVNEDREPLNLDLDYIKIDSTGACKAIDNLVVGLAEKDK